MQTQKEFKTDILKIATDYLETYLKDLKEYEKKDKKTDYNKGYYDGLQKAIDKLTKI